SHCHHTGAQQDVGRRGKIDPPTGEQKLLIDRLEQEEVQVAVADQVGKGIAVLQEQRLDQTFQGEVTADEKQVLRLGPLGNHGSLGKNRLVESEQDDQPEQFHGNLDEEIAAERQLPCQAEPGQGGEQAEVAAKAQGYPPKAL